MILFISSFEDEDLKKFAKNFNNSYGIKTRYINTGEFLSNQPFSVYIKKNSLGSVILKEDFDSVKICYLNSQLFVNPDDFDYSNKKDTDYALQEWSAAFLALFGTQENTRFINPFLRKYNFASEIEQLLIMQRSGLDTIDIALSNNSGDVIELNKIWNKCTIMKESTMGYAKSTSFTQDKFLKLPMLKYTPCIFQEGKVGENIEILILAEEYLAMDLNNSSFIEIPKGLKERLLDFCNQSKIKFATFNAVIVNGRYYFYCANQYPVFSMIKSIYQDNFIAMFEKFLVKEYQS